MGIQVTGTISSYQGWLILGVLTAITVILFFMLASFRGYARREEEWNQHYYKKEEEDEEESKKAQ